MKKTRRRYDREFEISIISELEAGKPLAQVVREQGIHPSLPCRWNHEIGCASGLISRGLAGGVRRLVATDIDPHAVRADRADGVDAVHADLLLGIRGRFDLVLFNAPYLPTGPEERTGQWIDQALDGGASGT
jgi:methylase of polypeptide subunit release factors